MRRKDGVFVLDSKQTTDEKERYEGFQGIIVRKTTDIPGFISISEGYYCYEDYKISDIDTSIIFKEDHDMDYIKNIVREVLSEPKVKERMDCDIPEIAITAEVEEMLQK